MQNRGQQNSRNVEGLPLEPTERRKACKQPGKTQEKGLWGAHAKKQNLSRFRAYKPCKTVARKTPETSPTKRTTERKIAKRLKRQHYWKIVAKRPKRHRRNGKAQEKGLWGAHAKKQNPSRFRA